MSNKIIVFSLKGCGHCVILKKDLNGVDVFAIIKYKILFVDR